MVGWFILLINILNYIVVYSGNTLLEKNMEISTMIQHISKHDFKTWIEYMSN